MTNIYEDKKNSLPIFQCRHTLICMPPNSLLTPNKNQKSRHINTPIKYAETTLLTLCITNTPHTSQCLLVYSSGTGNPELCCFWPVLLLNSGSPVFRTAHSWSSWVPPWTTAPLGPGWCCPCPREEDCQPGMMGQWLNISNILIGWMWYNF